MAVALLAYFLMMAHHAARESAEQAGHNEANILASRFGAILKRASGDLDYIARKVAPAILAKGSQRASDARSGFPLDSLAIGFPEIEGYFIIDASGLLVSGTDSQPAGIRIDDRSYFQAAKSKPDSSIRFSEVINSRQHGRSSVIVHRAILGPSGEFDGLVVAPIDLTQISTLFSKLKLGEQGIASIRRTDDSRLVVRWPDHPSMVNGLAQETLPYKHIQQGKREGTTRNPGKVDGIDRVFSFRVVEDFPFYVLIGRSEQEVFGNWRTMAATTIALTILILGGIAGMLVRLQHRTMALRERESVMSAIVAQAGDAIELTDLETLRFVEFNDAACNLLGYSREEYAQLRVTDIQAGMPEADLQVFVDRIRPGETHSFETLHKKKNGELFDVHVTLTCLLIKGRRKVTSIWRDITQRKQREQLLDLRHSLATQVRLGDQDQLLRKALDAAESMTHSQIGFLHFVEEDQQSVSLQVWSSNTLARMCFARGDGAHYPVSEAGVWVDCIHQRKPVIHNDYAALPHRKGLPEGHAPLVREATVPLIRDQRVVAVVGVGNKATDYTEADIAVVAEITELVFDFVERQRAEKQVEFMAYHDTLTGLPNRTLILDLINQAIGQCRRSSTLIAVGYINLDGFKPINDSYGYGVGDQVLVGISARLKETLRQGDALARIGGDEFVVMLTGLASADECERAMQRIHGEINLPVQTHGQSIEIAGCVGATLFPLDDAGSDALVHHAHHAMYQAKSTGRAGYRMYDPVQEQQLRDRRRLREEFGIALDQGQLVLFYQPKISLSDGRVVGAEALVRWQHPERGLLAPGLFLPQIEKTPLDIRLGEWVVRTAVAQLGAWLTAGIRLVISVNISPQHLQSPGFYRFLESALAGSPPETASHLELEILEVAGIDNADNTSDVMHACKKLGVQFSLDDFGTGYSSLTHFHNLPIDVVKIDQNFVRSMLDRPSDRDIVQGVLRLADLLKRPVVAEGVENIEIGLLLLTLGCPYAQGYGIARPMPADQLPAWLSNWNTSSRWHQLGVQSVTGSHDPDLDVAIFSHRNWLDQIQCWLHGDVDAVLPEMVTDRCPFSHWYHGIGRARYGSHPSYAFLPPKHSQVHETALQAVSATREKNPNKAAALNKDLIQISDEFLALLATLPDH